ncbi:hypothetical protein IBX38_00020 [Candidatus Bathyarchaeota archaeon]|nr:hypothetical protein [Candidatus Bathyarchaeota archaeon]
MVTAPIPGSLVYGAPNQAYSTELSAPEKTLTFLTDVVKLDVTKYNAKLVSHMDFPSDLDGLTEERVKYALESAGSKLDVTCRFRNNALVYCKLYLLEGSPLFAQPSTNSLDDARGLLDRYQTYSGASYIHEVKGMLDTVTEPKPMTTTSGNVKLKISGETYTYIDWIYTVNGIDFDRNRIHFSFLNGAFNSFRDDWDLYKIGSTDVNVSEEEAIRTAREHAQNYTLKIWQNEWIEVEFNIVDEPVEVEFSTQPREPDTLYPLWDIQLYFDTLYYGWNGIKVRMWADTGEVVSVTATGGLAGPPDGGTPTVPPNETPLGGSTGKTGLDPTPLLIAVPIVLAIIRGVALYRRRKD